MTGLRLWLTRAAPGTAGPLGRELLRRAVARTAGTSPDTLGRAVRTCLHCEDPDHGPPRWPGSGVWASLSRAGAVVVVAAVRAPSAERRPEEGTSRPGGARTADHGLGVDVVAGTGRLVPRPVDLLSAEEQRTGRWHRGDDLLRLWARKEAVVKAAGLGLALPVSRVTVVPEPDAPGSWAATIRAGRPGGGADHDDPARSAPRQLRGTDVDVSHVVGGGHHVAVALVGGPPQTPVVAGAAELLGPR